MVNSGESGRIVASRDQGHLFLGFSPQIVVNRGHAVLSCVEVWPS